MSSPRKAASMRGAGTPIKRSLSERVVLEEPGLRQHRLAILQIAAQLDRLGAGDREVELGAPMAGDPVRHRLGEDVGELAPRGRQHSFRRNAKGEVLQGPAQELDHEFPYAL